MSRNRQAVTLRFNPEDIQIMKAIIKRELGAGFTLELGLKQVIINIMQNYINQIKAENSKNEVPTNPAGSSEDGDRVPAADSSVPSDG